MACDFLVAVTVRFRVLFVFLVLEIGSLRILHCNVTAHPTAEWTLQQLRDALPSNHPYQFLIHDRDTIFSPELDAEVKNTFGLRVLRTPVRHSPSGSLPSSRSELAAPEKFVPGTCVICHGGDHYAGRFPEDGTGNPDVGAHFLPYDTGNFEFSSQPGLTEADQSASIFQLNQNALNATTTAAIRALVTGWYAGGTTTLNESYLDGSWPASASSLYQNVNARSCRSCHGAMPPGYDLENYGAWTGANFSVTYRADMGAQPAVCGKESSLLDYSMPNSPVTFNRFWGSSGTAIDQPSIMGQSGFTTLVPAPFGGQPSSACALQ